MKQWVLAFGLALALAVAMPGATANAQVAQEHATRSASPANPIPYKKEEASTGAMAGKTFVILALLLGLAFAGLIVVRRMLPQWQGRLPSALKVGGRRLKLIETMRLAPRTSLYLIQLDERVLLLAQSGDSITQVHTAASATVPTDDVQGKS